MPRRRSTPSRARLTTLLVALAAAIWLAARTRTPREDNHGAALSPQDSAAGGALDSLVTPPVSAPTTKRTRTLTVPRRIPTIEERARKGERVGITATAYCLQGRTRRGNLVRDGIVAADPKLFRLGASIRIWVGRRELGTFLVDDTGKDIKGGRLDIWMAECSQARRFGRRRGYAQLSR
jgi:3D (Asp-Asp-Asp) domain-containing protein